MRNRKFTIILIILLCLITISFTIFFAILLTNSDNKIFNFGHKISNELVYNKNYNEAFDEILIESKSSEIFIKESSSNEVSLIVYGDKDKTNVDISNNKLKIVSDSKSCFGFCFNTTIGKIELIVPSNFDKNLVIKNSYGDIEIGKLSNAKLDVKINSGDIKIESLYTLKVSSDYGEINISGFVNELDIDEKCGDVNINEVNDAKVTNAYGDIKVKKINNYLNIDEKCGDIKIDEINISKNSNIKNNYGDIVIGETNKVYIDAKTSLGDVKINNNYKNSNVTLNIKNDCGDITVNN